MISFPFFIIDWEFQVDSLFSQMRIIGFLILETGMFLYLYEVELCDLILGEKSSLKWHYEVLRWFDQYVGEKK